MQQVGVILLRKPTRLPAFVVAQPKTVRMCFVPQTSLLLLFLLRLLCAFLERLARFSHCAFHALRCLRFRCCRRSTIRCRTMMLRHFHDDVAGPLLITEAAAHWRGTQSLPSWPFVDEAARDEERVHVERLARIFGFALGIGNRAAESFLHFFRHSLF